MSTRLPFDQRLEDRLEDGPTDAPDHVLETILAALPSIPQRRAALRVPRRFRPMTATARVLAGFAAVAAILVGALILRPGSSPSAVGTTPSVAPATPAPPASSTSPTPSGSPTAPNTAEWTPFISAWYGFSAAYPPGYAVHRATVHWNLVRDQTVFADTIDSFSSPGGLASPIRLEAWETRLPSGTTSDAFIQSYIAPNLTGDCYEQPSAWTAVTIGGHAGRLAYSGCGTVSNAEASVVVGDRIYWFGINQSRPDLQMLQAFFSTVTFHPETAVDEAISPSPSP